jgi:hypothetical protein
MMKRMQLSTRIALGLLSALLALSLDPIETMHSGVPSLSSARAKSKHKHKRKKHRARHRHKKHHKSPPTTEM